MYCDYMATTATFSEVMGHNVRKLRGKYTMDEVAQVARKKLGLRWSSGNVSAIEAGTSSVTITNLLILSYVLGELTGQSISPLDLLEFEGRVKTGIRKADILAKDFQIWFQEGNPQFKIDLDTARKIEQKIRSGEIDKKLKKQWAGIPKDATPDEVIDAEDTSTPAEDRAAKSLDMQVRVFRFWARRLWGQSFEDKRDELAGEAASPQKKGRISRELKYQIFECYKKELERVPDDTR